MKQYRYVNRLSLRNRVTRMAWGVVWALLFRPTPRWALHCWRRGLLRAFGATVGAGCRIDPSARIWLPSNLCLGDYVAIAEDADIYCVAPITIGSKTTVSQRAFLCTASHDITRLTRPLTMAPIDIGDHVWIAAEAMVYPGACLGEGAVVAARGVFRGTAAPWTIHAGNPGRQVGMRQLVDALAGHPAEDSGSAEALQSPESGPQSSLQIGTGRTGTVKVGTDIGVCETPNLGVNASAARSGT